VIFNAEREEILNYCVIVVSKLAKAALTDRVL